MFKTMAKQCGDGTSGGEHAIIVAVWRAGKCFSEALTKSLLSSITDSGPGFLFFASNADWFF